MSQKLLIDLLKLRALGPGKAEAIDRTLLSNGEFKTIKELATFQFTCRRCEDAPCVAVCPADALEKDDDGKVVRSVNLCIRCKSCVVACPFGTMTLGLFKPILNGRKCYDISDENEMKEYADQFSDEVVCLTDSDENPEENIYKLNERVLIKDMVWRQPENSS